MIVLKPIKERRLSDRGTNRRRNEVQHAHHATENDAKQDMDMDDEYHLPKTCSFRRKGKQKGNCDNNVDCAFAMKKNIPKRQSAWGIVEKDDVSECFVENAIVVEEL